MTYLILLGLAGAGYLAATVRFQKALYAPEADGEPPRGRGLLWAAFLLHTAAIAVWGVQLGRLPGSAPPETLALMSWMMMGMYLVLASAWKLEVLGAFASPLATLLVLASLATSTWGAGPTAPTMRGGWMLVMHIAAVLLGYAAFTLATIIALLYVFQTRLLKQKNVTGIFRKLPSLEALDRTTYRLIAIGFPAMVLGIALGFLRAEMTGGRFWSPDVLLGLITCGIYAVYIHARMVGGWQGRRVNMLLLVGFVFLMATYVGIGVLPRGVHRDLPAVQSEKMNP